MALASKEKTENKKQNESVNKISNSNGVVIAVYMESVRTRSRQLKDPAKKRKQGTHPYDRRALLLAYSRELRNGASKNASLPTNQSLPRTKSKGIWLSQPVRICSRSSSTQMSSSSSMCTVEREAFKNSKERSRNASQFLSKMKNMLKHLSCKEI